jgi:hypothetical protein
MSQLRSYGLHVTTEDFANDDEIFVRIMTREGGAHHPLNPRGDGESSIWDAPKQCEGLLFADLRLRTTTSEINPLRPILSIEYDNLRFVTLEKAKKAAATLTKIDRQLSRDNAIEPGDILMSFARAVHATFHVIESSPGKRADWLPDRQWRFAPITSARDEFRRQIALNSQKVIDRKTATNTSIAYLGA